MFQLYVGIPVKSGNGKPSGLLKLSFLESRSLFLAMFGFKFAILVLKKRSSNSNVGILLYFTVYNVF